MRRWVASGLLAAMLAGMTPGVALAGSGGRRNTALGLSGAAVYTWLNGGFKHAGRRNTALVLTAASVMAWHKYNQSKRSERRRARLARYYASRRSSYYTRSYGYGRPVSAVRGYRSSYYAPARTSRVSARRTSHRYCRAAYSRGYRAGYQAAANAGA
jgi:hypothetical protein